jgi:hypothetical protein
MPQTIYADTFTHPDGTLLRTTTSDSGHKYSASPDWFIKNNRAYPEGSGQKFIQVLESDGVTPYQTPETFDLIWNTTEISGDGNNGFLVCAADINNGFLVRIRSGKVEIYTRANGNFTLRYTGSIAINSVLVRFEVRKYSVALYVDNVLFYKSFLLNFYDTASGLFLRASDGVTSTSGYHIDDVEIVDQPAEINTAPAQYFYDFSSASVIADIFSGSEITSISDLSVVADASAGNGESLLIKPVGGYKHRAYRFIDAGITGDQEIVGRVKYTKRELRIALRSIESVENYGVQYLAFTAPDPEHGFLVYDPDYNLITSLSGGDNTSLDDYFRFRLQVIGSVLKYKVWGDLSAEPASWDLEVTNTVIEVGYPALWSYWGDTEYRFDWVGVGVNGLPAPDSPVAVLNTPTNPSVTDLLATSARLNWEQG